MGFRPLQVIGVAFVSAACVTRAAGGRAKACHIHGGTMDYVFAQNKLDEIPPVIKMIRDGDNTFEWSHTAIAAHLTNQWKDKPQGCHCENTKVWP